MQIIIPNFEFFNVKSRSVKGWSLKKMLLKKSKNPSAFVYRTIGSNNSFTVIEYNFRFFKIAKFECNNTLWPMDKGTLLLLDGITKNSKSWEAP